MKTLRCISLAVSIAVAISLPIVVHAAGKTPAKKKETPQTHVTIQSVDANSITISDGKHTTTYKIVPQTVIEIKGQKATVAELKPGMRASVTGGADQTVADHITASDAPKATPAPPAKKK
jgi:fibronectin type 3 domain-containing protein